MGDVQPDATPAESMPDARQRRSRDKLYYALDTLLGARDYAAISISDLAAQAGVGRQTFYRHFSSIDAMLEERLRIDLADQLALADLGAGGDDLPAWLRRVAGFAFTRVDAQPAIYRLILSGAAGSDALAAFRTQIGALLALAPPGGASFAPDMAGYVQSFYAGAIGALLLQWLEAGRTPDIAAMRELCAALVLPRV